MISHNRTHSDKGPPCVLKRLFNVTEIRPPGAVEMPVKKLTEENRPLVAISEPERKNIQKNRETETHKQFRWVHAAHSILRMPLASVIA
jgi:hypothetical protein